MRAPEFPSGSWFNTAEPLTLKALRGRLRAARLLDVLLRQLPARHRRAAPAEERFARRAGRSIGVHSPKFAHEADHGRGRRGRRALRGGAPGARRPRAARLWQQYAVRAWPTLVARRPRGLRGRTCCRRGPRRAGWPADRRAGRRARGDGHAAPRRRPVPCRPRRSRRPLRFPAQGARGSPDRQLLVADAGHHQLVELDAGRRDACCAGSAPASAAAPTAPEPRLRRAERAGLLPRRAVAGLRRRWSPTPPTTCCAAPAGRRRRAGTVDLAPGWPAPGRSPAPVPTVLSPWDVAWWPASDGSSSPRPACTCSGLRSGRPARRRPGRHDGRGAARRAGRRRLAGPAVRAGGRRRPALVRRLRDLGAALR